MTRDALQLADALDKCCDELLIFGNDFSKPLIEAAAELRRLHRAVAAETERCAGICEAITWSGDGKWFAARIREGGHVSEP